MSLIYNLITPLTDNQAIAIDITSMIITLTVFALFILNRKGL